MSDLRARTALTFVLGGLLACDGAQPPPPAELPAPVVPAPVVPAPVVPAPHAAVEPSPSEPAAPEEAPALAQPLVDVPALVGKDEAGAEALLGPPTSCETVSPSGVGASRKCNYRGGNVEVVFIGGKADWLTIYADKPPSTEHPALDGKAGPAVLARLGLRGANPVKGPLGLVYENTADGLLKVMLSQVSLSDDTLSYVYVKAKTP